MRLLIVDDSIFSQRFIKRIINTIFPDIEVILANSGEMALELFNAEKIDLIITDLLMTGMNGLELIRLIRENNNTVNIIVHSSDVQKAVRDEIDQYNVLAFINKPMNAEKEELLSSIIERCLNA